MPAHTEKYKVYLLLWAPSYLVSLKDLNYRPISEIICVVFVQSNLLSNSQQTASSLVIHNKHSAIPHPEAAVTTHYWHQDMKFVV